MARDMPGPRRIAVVLSNLGGPDGQAAVRPFLFNLFRDKAIIGLPAIFRYPLAALIAGQRAKSARANYARMGGGSPLLPETEKQSAALQAALADRLPGDVVQTFIAMRYWNPPASETAKAVAAFGPDEIILLPLYPQFSTTTTNSSVEAWRKACKLEVRTREVCCFPALPGLIEAHAARLREVLPTDGRPFRLLFSAHGLPEKIIRAGDPYQRQVEATAAAVAAALGDISDWRVCYQSRVGPMAWIGPSTAQAVEEAGRDGVGLVVSPIAFVSDHIETLVELDHDYAVLAEDHGVPFYRRAPALGVQQDFIDGLAGAAVAALGSPLSAAPAQGWTCEACGPICPAREAKAL